MTGAVSGIYLLGFAPYKIVKIGKAKNIGRRLDNYYYQSISSFPSKPFGYDHELIKRIASCVFLVGFVSLDASVLDESEAQYLRLARKHLKRLGKTNEWFRVDSFNYELVRQSVRIGRPSPDMFPESVANKYLLIQKG